MPGSQSPKLITTINFKGGVGKTTITSCLADTLSLFPDQRVLVSDLDAQMSLTQAITLNEDSGRLEDRFGKWYDISVQRKQTIFDAIEAFTRPAATFNFPVGFDVIYRYRIPSSKVSGASVGSSGEVKFANFTQHLVER